MKYSIIVPIYNVDKYLKKTIESVLNQSVKDYELILVNDGSPDDSLNICKQYAKNNKNIVIVNKKNGGLVSARKAGIEISKGEYIISLDGDDYISSDYLETIDNIIGQYPTIDMIFVAGYDDYNGKLVKYQSNYEGYFDKNEIDNSILTHCVNGITGCYNFRNGIVYKVVKKNILLNNIKYYDDKVSMGEDLLISTACIGDSSSIYICNKNLYYYRQFDEQMTKKYKKNLFVNENILITNLLEVAKDKQLPIQNQIFRHALEMAKSTIYNEISFNKTNKEINNAFSQIYGTKLYNIMCEKMDTSNYSRIEKIFAYLLKHKCNFLLKILGKLHFKLAG